MLAIVLGSREATKKEYIVAHMLGNSMTKWPFSHYTY